MNPRFILDENIVILAQQGLDEYGNTNPVCARPHTSRSLRFVIPSWWMMFCGASMTRNCTVPVTIIPTWAHSLLSCCCTTLS